MEINYNQTQHMPATAKYVMRERKTVGTNYVNKLYRRYVTD